MKIIDAAAFRVTGSRASEAETASQRGARFGEELGAATRDASEASASTAVGHREDVAELRGRQVNEAPAEVPNEVTGERTGGRAHGDARNPRAGRVDRAGVAGREFGAVDIAVRAIDRPLESRDIVIRGENGSPNITVTLPGAVDESPEEEGASSGFRPGAGGRRGAAGAAGATGAAETGEEAAASGFRPGAGGRRGAAEAAGTVESGAEAPANGFRPGAGGRRGAAGVAGIAESGEEASTSGSRTGEAAPRGGNARGAAGVAGIVESGEEASTSGSRTGEAAPRGGNARGAVAPGAGETAGTPGFRPSAGAGRGHAAVGGEESGAVAEGDGEQQAGFRPDGRAGRGVARGAGVVPPQGNPVANGGAKVPVDVNRPFIRGVEAAAGSEEVSASSEGRPSSPSAFGHAAPAQPAAEPTASNTTAPASSASSAESSPFGGSGAAPGQGGGDEDAAGGARREGHPRPGTSLSATPATPAAAAAGARFGEAVAAAAATANTASSASSNASGMSAKVVEQVAAKLAEMNAGDSLAMTLNPAELGRVRLRFVRQGEGWKLRIAAEKPESAEILARDVQSLEAGLAQRGRGQFSVEVETGQSGAEQQQAAGKDERPGSRAPYAAHSDTPSSEAQDERPVMRATGTEGRLDVLT